LKRLYLKLYLAFVGIVLAAAVAVGLAWHEFGEDEDFRHQGARGLVELLVERLPEPDDPELQTQLSGLAEQLHVQLEFFDSEGHPLHSSHGEFWAERPSREGFFGTDHSPGRMFRLEDGRWLAVFFPHSGFHHRFFVLLGVFGVAIAVGCYPLARQITRRLEHLQRRVEAFGAGDLSARALVQGKDEVARLATSFNAAASQVQALVEQEKRMLASASHELRSPLARVRMAVELLASAEPARRAELVDEASRDIEELDELVEDLLASVRARGEPRRVEFDLGAVVEEEAARFAIVAETGVCPLCGDPRLLRRLVRNLIENARSHGRGARVNVSALVQGERALIVVEDEGPGVPEAERDRIFEPFYRPAGHDEGVHGGVGLGLSLVRQIAEQHRGRAWVEERAGGGSRFLVDLPLVPITASRSAGSPPDHSSAPPS
jgi:signal transduction histidine kinase